MASIAKYRAGLYWDAAQQCRQARAASAGLEKNEAPVQKTRSESAQQIAPSGQKVQQDQCLH